MDIKTTTDGDLDLTNGLDVATEQERDRHMVLVRVMTVRGEVPALPEMGVPDTILGKRITASLIREIEQEILASINSDFGLQDVKPIIRVYPTGLNSVTAVIQLQKEYPDSLGKVTIAGEFWNRDEEMTLLDGSQG